MSPDYEICSECGYAEDDCRCDPCEVCEREKEML